MRRIPTVSKRFRVWGTMTFECGFLIEVPMEVAAGDGTKYLEQHARNVIDQQQPAVHDRNGNRIRGVMTIREIEEITDE